MPYSVQCYLPRDAFEALDLQKIFAVARMVGIPNPRVESSTSRIPNYAPARSVRVTCSIDMAACLVEALAQQAEHASGKQDRALSVASSTAVTTLRDAIADATSSDHSLGFGPNS